MSFVSQISIRRGSFGRRLLIGMSLVALVVGLAVAPVGGQILAAARNARPHPLDTAFFARLPLAVQVHIAAAVCAILLGAALMWVRKGRLFHRTAGWTWVGLVSLVAGSSLFITSLNHGRYSLLHLLTGWTLIVLPLAVLRARRHEVAKHRRTMMGLFYGGFVLNTFIAFIPGRAMWSLFFG